MKNNVEDYKQYRSKYFDKAKGAEFKKAVQEMDDFLKDPTVRIKSLFHQQ